MSYILLFVPFLLCKMDDALVFLDGNGYRQQRGNQDLTEDACGGMCTTLLILGCLI
jgi:hypothetical protein